jgi:hypothetical protein
LKTAEEMGQIIRNGFTGNKGMDMGGPLVRLIYKTGEFMFREKIKVLDCTIRDGGLMNKHGFDLRFVRAVYKALSEAGVDYMEIGYKNAKRLFSPKEFGTWKFCEDDDIKKVTDGIESKPRYPLW